jgi:DNA-binding response OmpR family regulator
MAKTILLVEDEPSLASALTQKVASAGHIALTAKDGEEGLKLALDHHPDIILLDLLLPKRDGMSMLRMLRQDEWGTQVPVIILSNLSDSSHIFDSLHSGELDYLVKADSSLDDVMKQIENRLNGPSTI